MRLLVIIDRYPPYHTGGDETSCQSIVEGLKQRGHDVVVLTSTYGVGKPAVEGNVYRLLRRPSDTSSLFQQARWELESHWTFKRLLEQSRPDAIVSWSLFSLFPSLHIALKESGLPIIYDMQNIWIDRQLENDIRRQEIWHGRGSTMVNRIAKPFVRSLVRFLNSNCLRPISIKEVDLRYVVQCSYASEKAHNNAGLYGKDWTVIYNGIDMSCFKDNCRDKTNGSFSILFAGRFVKDKGPHTLIEAFAELIQRGHKQIQLRLAGVPGYPKEYVDGLHRLVAEKEINKEVSFLGAVPYSEMPKLFQEHDVLVFPSIAPEGFPMTLIEAMACGLTVVGTTTGGSAEILSHRVNSLTFTPGCVTELVTCLDSLITDNELRLRLACSGQQWVRDHCDIKLVLDQWELYLKHAVEKSPASSTFMVSQ
jgi:glycogen(starch) synthase